VLFNAGGKRWTADGRTAEWTHLLLITWVIKMPSALLNTANTVHKMLLLKSHQIETICISINAFGNFFSHENYSTFLALSWDKLTLFYFFRLFSTTDLDF